jgi:hypothetical protein
VEGRPTSPTGAGERRYALELGGERVPLRLVILYRGQVVRQESTGSAATLSAPVFVDLPVERTLWSVASALPPRAVTAAEPSQRVSRPQQDLLRLEALAGLLDLPEDVQAERKPEELERWYLAWSRRWFAIYLPQTEHDATAGLGADELLWQRLDQEQVALAERYGVEHVRERAAAEAAKLANGHRLWMRPEPTERAAALGAAPTFAVRIENRRNEAPAPYAAIGLIVLASCAGAWLSRRIHYAEGLARWAPLLCVLAGVAWWLWLAPAFWGVVWVVIGLWLTLRPAMRQFR